MSDYQYVFNGLTIGDGTDYHVESITGLTGYGMNLVNLPMPRAHGSIPGRSYMTGREIGLVVSVSGADATALAESLDALLAAYEPMSEDESPFTWEHPGQAGRRVECRVADLDDSGISVDTELGLERRVSVRLVASDPAVYSSELTTAVLTPFVGAGGLSYPVAYPKAYGSGGSGGGSTVANAGKFPTWPTIEISGPVSGTLTNPVAENVTTGEEIALTADGGASVTAGQTLVIETRPLVRSVKFLTGASRYGNVSVGSVFWALRPGDNDIRFRASGQTTGATMTVKARSAWLRG